MENEFVTYEQALALKELGFDEPCIGYYYNGKLCFDSSGVNLTGPSGEQPLPLYQQAFSWFREKHQLYGEILLDKTTEPKFCFKISKFIGNPNDLSEREWDWENIPNDDNWGLYRKYEEAELACLNKLIELIKTNKYEKNNNVNCNCSFN
jgi:hypothetical protein